MAFALTREQRELRDLARRYLADVLPLDRLGTVADSAEGWEPASWGEFASLGWLGVRVPEEHGGTGLGWIEQIIVIEELGRALYPGPYLVTACALDSLSVEQQAEVASGSTRWSIEVDELVPDLDRVDRVVTPEGEAGAEAAEIVAGIDPTRRTGRLTSGTRRPMRTGPSRIAILVALAAEALGVAQRSLDLAVEYAGTRSQFGRVIGSYQAVSHPLSDSFCDIELARSLVYSAACRLETESPSAWRAASQAKAFATETAVAAAERAIQVHGGIGFTWEHPLHRFYKRAMWLSAFAGHSRSHRAVVVEALGRGEVFSGEGH